MRPQLLIGLYTEGPTDIRFLESIIKRTFEEICYECPNEVEILDIQKIKVTKSTFMDDVINASRKGVDDFGIMVLCIHADADSDTDADTYQYRINPAVAQVNSTQENICKVIVPIVPIQMTEAWMLADKVLLKKQIGTKKNDEELNINKRPEDITDPKQTIKDAIRISQEELRKRQRNELKITDLYLPIGQAISLESLKGLSSYQKFRESVYEALKQLNYLH